VDKFLPKRPLEESIEKTIKDFGFNSIQVFTHNPRSGAETKINYENVKAVTEKRLVFVHSSYNSVSVWKVKNSNKDSEESKKILNSFEEQLKSTVKIRGKCLVLHISKRRPEEVAETMAILKPIAIKHQATIGIEMVASHGDDKTYETPQKINYLLSLLGDPVHSKNNSGERSWYSWYGLVVDTAHIWAAGVDIREKKSMDKWLSEIKPEYVSLFHLNGSYNNLSSGKDKHAVPFAKEDKIWGNIKPENSGLTSIIQYCCRYKIPAIMETKKYEECYDDILNVYNIVIDIAKSLT